MTMASLRLSDADFERIYTRRIRPDVLDGIEKSKTPTAVLLGGQPGTGVSYAGARVRHHIAPTLGATAVVSTMDLREYHPHWRRSNDPAAHTAVQPDLTQWCSRLITDGTSRKVNLIIEIGAPDAALSLARRLQREGYRLDVVVLAMDRDQSRQMLAASIALAQAIGMTPPFDHGSDHDRRHVEVRESLARLEAELAVDRIQLVAQDGRQLFSNERVDARWANESKAAHVLDDFRERQSTPRDMAQTVLRWESLLDSAVLANAPGDIVPQATAWSAEAASKADGDPQARDFVRWGREAQALRTQNRVDFLQAHPQHAKAVERLEEAIAYAENTFPNAIDRERFVEQARLRLAERLAEGRALTTERTKKTPTKEPRTR